MPSQNMEQNQKCDSSKRPSALTHWNIHVNQLVKYLLLFKLFVLVNTFSWCHQVQCLHFSVKPEQ